jgi:hypothetical protein
MKFRTFLVIINQYATLRKKNSIMINKWMKNNHNQKFRQKQMKFYKVYKQTDRQNNDCKNCL